MHLAINEVARKSISAISGAMDDVKRDKEKVGPLLVDLGLYRNVIRHSRYAVVDMSTLLELAVKMTFSFYKGGYPHDSLKFFDILMGFEGEGDLYEFFKTAGVEFNRGRPFLRHHSPLSDLRYFRNHYVEHGISGIMDSVLTEEQRGYTHIEQLMADGTIKRIKIPTPYKWCDVVARAYVNLVESYNKLMTALDMRVGQEAK